jgi:hypothetical protein
MNKPIEISLPEWKEIMEIPGVRDSWGLEDNETHENFAAMVYGVKFKFHSGSPGYVGDLYIILGDTLAGDPPLMFTRHNGVLRLEEFYAFPRQAKAADDSEMVG